MDVYIRDFKAESAKTYTVNTELECKEILNVNKQSSNFKVIHGNIRSLSKNLDEFKVLLCRMETRFDCIVLTETWQLPDCFLYNLPGYDMLYNNGDFNQNDGVVIYIKQDYDYKYEIVEMDTIKLLKIKVKFGNSKFVISAVYRSPSSSVREFNALLQNYLETHCKHSSNTHIFVGDINIDILEENDNCKEYLNILYECGFISTINEPTRLNSCIDHIFLKSHISMDMVIPLILRTDITDHFTIVLQIINNKIVQAPKDSNIKKFIDYKKLKLKISNIDWQNVYSLEDPNEAVNEFVKVIIDNTNQCTNIKKCSRKNSKITPWLTNALLNSINKKNSMFKSLKKNPNNQQLKEEYKAYRNRLTSLINKTKQHYYKQEIENNSTNTKYLWKMLADLSEPKCKDNEIDTIINENNDLIFDKQNIADEFNKRFAEMGRKLAEKLPQNVKINTNDNRLPNTMVLTLVEEHEVADAIGDLKDKKSTGIDGLQTEILKSLSGHIVQPLKYIINKCFEKGIWPEAFKRSVVVPIYKKGDPTVVTNYRPISLITNLSKVFERILQRNLTSFIQKYDLISARQYGFKPKTSTEDALLALTEKINSALERGRPCLCLFIDLAKAFDTVSHDMLLGALYDMGIRGNCFHILKSYLRNRTQVVKLNNILSKSEEVDYGVPQGTILGPILFNIYINNLFSINTTGEIFGYADDTAVFYEADTWQELKLLVENDMKQIKDWFDHKLLTINLQKTHFIPFSCNKANLPLFKKIVVKTQGKVFNIESVQEIKYLGIYLDTCLKWNTHINYVIKKLRFIIYKFNFFRNYLPIKSLKTLYSALVESHIRYCIAVWGAALRTHINPLEILQKRFLKLLMSKNQRYPSDQLYTESGFMDVRQLFYFHVGVKYYLTGNKNYNIHSYNTRAPKYLILPSIKKSLSQRSFCFISKKIYNSIPECIKDLPTIFMFKKYLKTFIFESKRKAISELIET